MQGMRPLLWVEREWQEQDSFSYGDSRSAGHLGSISHVAEDYTEIVCPGKIRAFCLLFFPFDFLFSHKIYMKASEYVKVNWQVRGLYLSTTVINTSFISYKEKNSKLGSIFDSTS